jgi:hypothetical protein
MPRIKMTRTVKMALFFLRVYLIVLLGLILVKFLKVFTAPEKASQPVQTTTYPAQRFT